jgi:hypothetical protein
VSTFGTGKTPYEVRDAQIEETLRTLGGILKTALTGTNHGFTLFLFGYGEGGNCFYLSSADRQDMLAMLKEFIAREEARG